MRRTYEIKNELQRFEDRVWLERHEVLNLRGLFEEYLNSGDKTKIEIANGAILEAQRIREKYKNDPVFKVCNDFEWGKINGKLSTLRWLLGEEWDMLDT